MELGRKPASSPRRERQEEQIPGRGCIHVEWLCWEPDGASKTPAAVKADRECCLIIAQAPRIKSFVYSPVQLTFSGPVGVPELPLHEVETDRPSNLKHTSSSESRSGVFFLQLVHVPTHCERRSGGRGGELAPRIRFSGLPLAG